MVVIFIKNNAMQYFFGGMNMRVLNVEDNVIKHHNIKRALETLGIREVTWVKNEYDAIKAVKDSIDSGGPFDLIISDMYFPLFPGSKEDENAGFTFIGELNDNNIDIPVIVCSSIRLSIPGILGCVYYSSNVVLDEEFKNLLKK